MTDFKDDEWKMTPSHNIKSVEDFLNDTSSIIDESNDDDLLEKENSLEDSLSDWGISVPEIITVKESDEDSAVEKPSIFDHLGTSFVDEDKSLEERDTSLPSDDDLGYPDEVTGEFEINSSKIDGERSLFDEVTGTHEWRVESDRSSQDDFSSEDDVREDESLALSEEPTVDEPMEVTSVDDPSLPNENDLEYPDIDAIIKETAFTDEPKEESEEKSIEHSELEEGKEIVSMLDGISSDDLPEDYKPRSQLTSLEELNNELDSFKSDSDISFEVTTDMKNEFREEIPSDVEADDFWAIDEFPSISGKLESSGKEGAKASDIKADFFNDSSEDESDGQFKMRPSSTLSSINLSDVGGSGSISSAQNINIDEIVEKVKEALAPQLEEVVKKLFSQKIEQVAWEVIPDLAENVIKKEVEDIAKHVYSTTKSTKKE